MIGRILYVAVCTIGAGFVGGAAAQCLCEITNQETRGNYGLTPAGLLVIATMFVSAGIGFGLSISN